MTETDHSLHVRAIQATSTRKSPDWKREVFMLTNG